MSLTPPPDLTADIARVLRAELPSPSISDRVIDSAARAVAVLVVERAAAETQRSPAE